MTGSEAYAQTLAEDQAAHGHQIFVVSDTLHLPFPGTVASLPVSTGSFWKRMRNILWLIDFLKKEKIDLIHCHSRAACRHAHWATRFTQTPVLTTLHGYQHVSFSKKLFNIYGDTVIAVCEKIRDQLCRDFALDPASVKVLRNPMNFDWREPGADRMSLSLIGRASGPKGRRLLEVFRAQSKAWLEMDPALQIELVLPGLALETKGSLLSSLPKSLQNRVRIETEHRPLDPVLQRSKIVIASGRIALEAFAAGCEVIALGEARLEGRLNEDNLALQLATNFGDVGLEEALDPSAVHHELRKVLRDPLSDRAREKLRLLLEKEFGKERILAEIEELARGTRLLKKARGLPILMYHKVPSQEIRTRHRIFVTKENFEKHLMFFHSQGFATLTFQDLADFWFERRPLSEFPEKPLLLTFDDGYRDNLENALPLLRQYGMMANLFLLADHSITANNWDSEDGVAPAPLMTLEEKKNLPPEIYHVGSHGLQHLDLRALSDEQILEQMMESKKILERDLGRPVHAFAYPFGWVSEKMPALARKAGYDFAVNTDRGALRWTDDRFSLFRVNIFPEESWFSLWKKTSPGYRRRYFKKRGQ